jgi:mannose-1-phosphate guanylyltransferase/mannose-6-phosphate isomerase
MQIVPVILCGGSGTRLWPLSRALYPKQLLKLVGDDSLLAATVARLAHVPGDVQPPLVVCNEAHRFLVARQLADAGCEATILLEPEGRNTAPAIAAAAGYARQRYKHDVLLLALPADHVIRDAVAFGEAVAAVASSAVGGSLVTFGVLPTAPETGYGYIRADVVSGTCGPIREFVEKPDIETAQRYLRSGSYLWNSGMFLFSAETILREISRHASDIHEAAANALGRAVVDGGFVRLDAEAFRRCRNESIDYAVMERTELAAVVPLDAGWSDVGSWGALAAVSPADADGNVLVGDVLAIDCSNSLVRAESRLVGVVGLDGCVVVETRDAVLVVPRERSQEVKKLVAEIEARHRPEATVGREVFRPWGSYDSVDGGSGFQVKRLTVLPGAVLSLQLHRRRAEHWVVVAGRARITCDEAVFDLGIGEHTFIPLGARHRIENPGTGILIIIEVQVGDYLGEDDIVRLEDRYGRQGRTD